MEREGDQEGEAHTHKHWEPQKEEQKHKKSGGVNSSGAAGQPSTSFGLPKRSRVQKSAGVQKCRPTPSCPPRTEIILGGARVYNPTNVLLCDSLLSATTRLHTDRSLRTSC